MTELVCRPSLLVLAAAAALPSLLPGQFFQPVPGTVPPAAAELLVRDDLRDRTVAFFDAGTWEHDGQAWRAVATATAPSNRYEFAMCYDGQRVLLYGGQDNSFGARDDLWAYDGTNWTLLTVGQGPGRRRAAALAYDSLRQRVVLYGGTNMQGGFPADTWEWNGATWNQASPTGPGSRVWHRMIYDEARQRVVLCAGAFNPVTFVDTWEWNGATWTQTVATQFPFSTQPALVFDRSTQRTLAFGGMSPLTGSPRDEVWAYEPNNATWMLVASNTPTMQQTVGAAYDDSRQRTLVLTQDPLFGGSPDDYYYRDQGTPVASYRPYGVGCATSTGIPMLAAAGSSLPTLGTAFTTQVTATGNALLAALVVGWSSTLWNGAPLPASLAPAGFTGCNLLASADAVLGMTISGGNATLTRPLPNLVALRGTVLFEQAVLLDLTAPNGLGALSNGARMLLN